MNDNSPNDNLLIVLREEETDQSSPNRDTRILHSLIHPAPGLLPVAPTTASSHLRWSYLH
jgi:hypothetical protein